MSSSYFSNLVFFTLIVLQFNYFFLSKGTMNEREQTSLSTFQQWYKAFFIKNSRLLYYLFNSFFHLTIFKRNLVYLQKKTCVTSMQKRAKHKLLFFVPSPLYKLIIIIVLVLVCWNVEKHNSHQSSGKGQPGSSLLECSCYTGRYWTAG